MALDSMALVYIQASSITRAGDQKFDRAANLEIAFRWQLVPAEWVVLTPKIYIWDCRETGWIHGCVVGLTFSSLQSCCDSSAARGVLSRLGTGKLLHLELRHLWVQEAVARGEVEIPWISRQCDRSDVLLHQSSNAGFKFKRCLLLLGHELRPDIFEQYLSEGVDI